MKSFFQGFFKGSKDFSNYITNIVNFVLLLFAYIIGIGPVSLIAKLFRKHFVDLGSKKKNSYWLKSKPVSKRIEDYYRTF
jgi:hypothetical protein